MSHKSLCFLMIIRNILLKGAGGQKNKVKKQEEDIKESIEGHDLCY